MSVTYQYSIPDIVCANCSNTVEKTLRATPFFKEQHLGVDPIEKSLTITFEEEPASYFEIRDVLNEVLEPVGFSCVEVVKDRVRQKQRRLSHRLLGVAGISIGVLFLGLSMLTLAPWVMATMMFLSLPLTLFLGMESYQKAWKKLKNGMFTMDSLFALSTLSILFVSVASLMFPMLPMMCEAGLLIFGFRHVGLAIEEAFKNTQLMTKRFQDEAPSKVIRFSGEKRTRVPLSLIRKKDVLLIYPGEILPVDGVFEEDDGLILDSIVTGSHMPRRIIANEPLYAGTVLSHAQKPLRFRVTSTASNSHLARLDAKIAYAKLEKATIETTTSRILQYFIPFILAVAIVSGLVIASVFSPALGIQSAIAVLVSACPCTLGLITPLAIKVGIKKAAERGVVFNSAKKLELADTVDCVVFDLNGTLTEGKPVVTRHGVSQTKLSAEAVLQLMGYFEEQCTHPVAKAIRHATVQAVRQTAFSKYDVELNDYAGRVLRYEGARYVIGSESLLVRQGVNIIEITRLRQKLQLKGGESLVFLAKDAQLMGYVVLKDTLRKDAQTVIQTLKQSGKRPYLCTGADLETAYEYAKQLGIPQSDVRANCVSHADTQSKRSKKKVIDDLHRKGWRVAVVGDGANDAEMIAAADVGFAISSGQDAHTQQHAAAVIKGESLQPVLHAFTVSKQTVRNVKENLWLSILYNVATVCLAAGLLLSVGIVLNPAVGAALMILQTSLIFLNVYRFVKTPVLSPEIKAQQRSNNSVQGITAQLQRMPQPKTRVPAAPKSDLNGLVSVNCLTGVKSMSFRTAQKTSTPSSRYEDTDVASVANSMRLTHS